MTKGDLVRWIGYPGANVDPRMTGPSGIGIIIATHEAEKVFYKEPSYTVAWSDGTIGTNLHPITLERVDEKR